MPTDYLAVDNYSNTVVIPSDGDKNKAATYNPAFMRLANNVRNVKDNAAFKAVTTIVSGAWTFSNILAVTGVMKMLGRLTLRSPLTLSNNVASQNIDLDQSSVFILRKPINSHGVRFLRLPMAGVNDGELVVFTFHDVGVSSGAGVGTVTPTERYDVREDAPGATTLAEFFNYGYDEMGAAAIVIPEDAFASGIPAADYELTGPGPSPPASNNPISQRTWAVFRYSSGTGHWSYLIGSGYVWVPGMAGF
jgi:hypothetical protein